MTTLYQLAKNLCSHQDAGFCEPCLMEAMSRWDGVARLIHEVMTRCDAYHTELLGVKQVLREQAVDGCLPEKDEHAVIMAQRVIGALKRQRDSRNS